MCTTEIENKIFKVIAMYMTFLVFFLSWPQLSSIVKYSLDENVYYYYSSNQLTSPEYKSENRIKKFLLDPKLYTFMWQHVPTFNG